MTAEVRDHYESLLATHYSWLLGDDFGLVVGRQRDLLAGHVGNRPSGTALDIGCGSGAQSLALVDLGFAPVIGLDLSPSLVDELTARSAGSSKVDVRVADVTEGLTHIVEPESVSVVVCMGDTLPHLPAVSDIRRLFADVREVLLPGSPFVLSLRDLSGHLAGSDRFVPVRADDSRILTCFLEDEDTHVRVHDLVHERGADGTWTLRVSSYRKLRIAPDGVRSLLAESGFVNIAADQQANGMWVISGSRPA